MDLIKVPPFRTYDLVHARHAGTSKTPFPHQTQALNNIKKWLDTAPKSNAGGIVVLPTGGGKTFTAIRFLCASIFEKGYKVLWLAHTHHLLDQAYAEFEKSIGEIRHPKTKLLTRVVSGDLSHDHIRKVRSEDDVVVATLQTITMAYQESHPALLEFLREAGEKLCVVFDEAHHAPAPSYRNLLKSLRENHSEMILLGLTATPTNTNPKKATWLLDLFPQGIIHQSDISTLIADKILARPNFERLPTNIVPEFDEAEYLRWVETYRDLPESIIKSLSERKDRNALIANHYSNNRERYGKTIIFADRWHQCVYLESELKKLDVRVGSIFSHVDAKLSSVEARNARTSDHNHKILQQYKNNEIDVLINVKMLTEGTDVPQTQTVFITRQTTSTILLTQMVGRALRGPKAGGTEEAFIVSFEDNWSQTIPWAGFDQIVIGPTPDETETIRKKRLMEMVSIDLVRMLADQMNSGLNIAPTDFLKLIPIGWYQVEIEALVEHSTTQVQDDDAKTLEVETVQRLVLVFEDQLEGYRRYLEELSLNTFNLGLLSSERATIKDAQSIIDITDAIKRFFPDQPDKISQVVPKDLFHIAQHVAQNDGELPRFFPFEGRQDHDLNEIVNDHYTKEYGDKKKHDLLYSEYHRKDRYWQALYPKYDFFGSQYDACMRRLVNGPPSPPPPPPIKPPPEQRDDREPSTEMKREIKARDGYRCLCCGESETRRLQVDHVVPWYFGGRTVPENLQTLCKNCNKTKGITYTDFRIHADLGLASPRPDLPEILPIKHGEEVNRDVWEGQIRRSLNFFYNAAAVEHVFIGAKGRGFYEWIIQLHEGNRPDWLAPHLPGLLDSIRTARKGGRVKGPEGIRIVAPGFPETSHFASCSDEHRVTDFPEIPNGTECRVAVEDQVHDGIFLACDLKLKFGSRSPFASFSEAYKSLTGRQRNDWKGWQFRLPGSPEWVRGDELRSSLRPTIRIIDIN